MIRVNALKTKAVAAASAFALSTLLTGCGSEDPALASDGDLTVRYQSGAGLMNHLELAEALGYFDSIKIKYVGEVAGGPQSLQAVATGDSDLAVGPFNGSTAKVVSGGKSVKAIAAATGSSGDIRTSILALDGSPIQSAKDLVGKKVGVNTLGAAAEAIVHVSMKKAGLKPDEIADVTLVPLSTMTLENALRKKQVDAIVLGQLPLEIANSNGGIRSIVDDVDVMGEFNGGSYVVRTDLLEKYPEQARELTAGIARAIDYEQTHTPAQTVAPIAKWLTEQGRGDYAKALSSWRGSGIATQGGVLRDSDFSIWLGWLADSGDANAKDLDPSKLYDNEYNPFDS